MEFVYRVLATAVAVWVATLLPGVNLLSDSTPVRVGTLIGIALIFGLVNLILKPVMKIVGCVFYLLTLGLFGLVVNGLLLLLTSWIAGKLRLPFEVTGFWPGFWGAIVIAVVSFVLTIPLHVKHISDHARRQ
ncbi:MAG TPA: phage holin family protein [Pseudonocardiaceae bacterium]|nr:phage holin family protein [Pseudonocardiaceae bacterium]